MSRRSAAAALSVRVNNRSTGRENVYTLRGIRYDGDELSMKTTWEERGSGIGRSSILNFARPSAGSTRPETVAPDMTRFGQNFGTHFARTVQFGGQSTTP